MFKKKTCHSCGEKLKDDWNFCPFCGEEVEIGRKVLTPIESIFEDIEREMERMDKMFSFPSFKFSDFKSKPGFKGGGVSIVIRSGMGKEPKIEIKTSGEYKKIEPELKKRLGIKAGVEEVEEEKTEKEIERKVPKVTEEPETVVKELGNKRVISIKLPDVKSEEDVEIKKLEQSIEVKAFAGEKAYFTLIPVPKNSSIVNKKFKNGVLEIEIER